MNRTWRALGTLAIVALLIRFVIGCAAQQPTQPREVIIMLDTGDKVIQISPHPCEGNWNFCDQAMQERDDLDTFYIPAF